MELNSRQVRLVDYLSKQKNTRTVKDYASLLNVSERTISYDLKHIAPYLESKGIFLNPIPGVGLEIRKKSVKKQAEQLEVSFNRTDRQDDIMRKLLFENKNVTYQRLSKAYFVSKSSLRSDFHFLRKIYTSSATAKIISNREGTKLQGNEEQIRASFMLFNTIQVGRQDEMGSRDVWQRFLEEYYGKFLTDTCLDVINSLELSGISFVTPYYAMNLFNILTVMTYRSQLGDNIDSTEHNLIINELWNMSNILLAKDILTRVSSRIKVQFNEKEVSYLVKHLIANRISFSEIKLSTSEEVTLKSVTHEIIDNMSLALNINFEGEEKLENQLIRHLKPMIYRLTYNIKIVNPLLDDIKSEFRLIFNLLSMVLESVFDKLSLDITEDEIAFLVIYFQAAVEGKEESKRVLVVCPMGISTSQLVVNRIRNILPPLDILEVASVSQMMETDLSRVDFVVSTVPIELKDTPYIVVSPLVTESDVKNISKFYSKNLITKANYPEEEEIQRLPQVIFPSCIFIDSNSSSQKEIINNMCCQLYKQGFVNEKFVCSVFDREYLGSTGLPSSAAIPHGLMKNVKKNCVAFYINKNPVLWGQMSVKVVCMLCVQENEPHFIKEILADLFKLLKDKSKVQKLADCKTKEELMDFIKGSLS